MTQTNTDIEALIQEEIQRAGGLLTREAAGHIVRSRLDKPTEAPMIKRPETYITTKNMKNTFVLNCHTKTLTIFPLSSGNAYINLNVMTATIGPDERPIWDQLSLIAPIETIKQFAKLLVDNL